jgi:hypothetical protein
MSNTHIVYLHSFITQKMSRDENCLRKFIAHQSLHVQLPLFVARAGEEALRKKASDEAVSHITEEFAASTLEDSENPSRLQSGGT